MDEIIKLVLAAQIDGYDKVQKQLFGMAKKFSLNMSSAVKSLAEVQKVWTKSLMEGTAKARKFLYKNLYSAGVDALGSAMESSGKIFTGAMQNARGALQGSMEGLLKGFGGVTKDMGKRINKMGDRIEAALAKKGKGGQFAGASINLILKGLTPLLSLMGTVANIMSSIVGLIFDAEAKAKELNKAILDGGIAGGDLAAGVGETADALGALRGAAVDFRNNLKWGTVAKEQTEIIGAFNAAGYTLREMTKSTTNATQAMKDYQDATSVALTYSKLLGMSASEVATQQTEYMESLGGSLQFVEQQFSAVYKQAQLSGFGVKRFYSMIQQATSGMAMYNVRLDEAAGLLITLGNILGSKVAGDFLQQLSKGFVDQGMTERYKKVMITGVKRSQDIMYKEALNTASAFGQKLGAETEDVQKNVMKVLQNSGIDLTTDKGQKEAVDKLAKMSERDKATMIAEVRGLDAGLAQELGKLSKVSEAQLGGVTNVATAMDAMGPGGALAMQLEVAVERLGKPLHELKGVEIAGFEGITGISGEQRVILTKLSEGLYGQFDVLKKMAGDGDVLAEKLGMLSEENRMSLEQFQDLNKKASEGDPKALEQLNAVRQEMQQAYGAFIDGSGNIVKAQFDSQGNIIAGTEKTMDGVRDFVMGNAEKLSQATEKAMDENTLLAQEIAHNTTDLAKIMEMGVEYWLEQIYKVVQPFAAGVLKHLLGAPDPKEVTNFFQDIEKQMGEAREGTKSAESKLADLKREMRTASDDRKAEIQTQMDAEEKNILALQGKMKSLEVKREKAQAAQFDGSDWSQATKETVEGTKEMVKVAGGEEGAPAASALDSRFEEIAKALELSGHEYTAAQDAVMAAVQKRITAGDDIYKVLNEELTAEKVAAAATGGGAAAREEYESGAGLFSGLGVAKRLGLTEKGMESSGWRGMAMQEKAKQFDAAKAEERQKKAEMSQEDFLKHVEDVGLESAKEGLTERQLNDLMGGLSEDEINAADQRYKKQMAEEKKQKEEQAKRIAKLTVEEGQKAEMAKFLEASFGAGNVPPEVLAAVEKGASRAEIADMISGKGSTMNVTGDKGELFARMYQADPMLAQALLGSNTYSAGLASATKHGTVEPGTVDDFIARPGMPAQPFNAGDTLVGFKPGGPMEKAFRPGGMVPETPGAGKAPAAAPAAGGNKGPITIHIHGSQAEIYNTVKRVLREHG